ncbi:MAG: GDSL-type esterase/lipase family protein [bacterium]|nr:GDSL-type esterase/lipase family protein [bacterium]
MRVTLLLLLPILLYSTKVNGQDPTRFASEIGIITEREFEKSTTEPTVVFTGSSSIRMWGNLESSFPGYQVLNNGFGGSEFSDLMHYREELIYRFQPDMVFIYEGDNDVNSGKSTEEILEDAILLLSDIQATLPEAQLYLIAAKPSVARWHLKDEYERLNNALHGLTETGDFNDITFIDIWSPMLDDSGAVLDNIFISDNLHMNEKGYAIWESVIGEYLPKK